MFGTRETNSREIKAYTKSYQEGSKSDWVYGCGVVSCMFFAQHVWFIIWDNWPKSRDASFPHEVVNEDLTTSWCL